MKKIGLSLITALCIMLFVACDAQETGSSQQAEYRDIISEEKVFGEELLTEWSYVVKGMQFYRGEPIQLTDKTRMVVNENGKNEYFSDLYLYRLDGSSELVIEGMPHGYFKGDCFLDEEGNCYCITSAELKRVDSAGVERYCVSLENLGIFYKDICQLDDGRMIMSYRDKEGTAYHLAELEASTGEITELSHINVEFLGTNADVGAGPEGLYVLNIDGFWQVDTEKGTRECVLPFAGTTYNLGNSVDLWDFRVLEDRSVEILRAATGGVASRVEVLKPVVGDEEKVAVVMRGWMFNNNAIGNWIKERAAEFNKTNENYYIVLEEGYSQKESEDFARQTSVEIATGAGPDIIFGPILEDYIVGMLAKGAFADLRPYMETSGVKEEDYFPAAFDCWRLGEEIYGVNVMINLMGYKIAEEVLDNREVIDVETLVDSLLAWEEKATFLKSRGSDKILEILLEGTESLWGMVDWEKGSCDFGNELFAKILEVTKRYGYNEQNQFASLAEYRNCATLYGFESLAQLEKQGKVMAGVLFDDGCHEMVRDDWTMAINTNSEHKEGAWEFLGFLLTEESQRRMDFRNFPVNRAAFNAMVEKEMDEGSNGVDRYGNVIGKSEDGEPITSEEIEELIRTIEDAQPLPLQTRPILDIILEEATCYYDGTKTIAEIIPVIENRVQLYLDEHK